MIDAIHPLVAILTAAILWGALTALKVKDFFTG